MLALLLTVIGGCGGSMQPAQVQPAQRVSFQRSEGGWDTVVEPIAWEPESVRLEGSIDNSLYEALDAQVGDDLLGFALREVTARSGIDAASSMNSWSSRGERHSRPKAMLAMSTLTSRSPGRYVSVSTQRIASTTSRSTASCVLGFMLISNFTSNCPVFTPKGMHGRTVILAPPSHAMRAASAHAQELTAGQEWLVLALIGAPGEASVLMGEAPDGFPLADFPPDATVLGSVVLRQPITPRFARGPVDVRYAIPKPWVEIRS